MYLLQKKTKRDQPQGLWYLLFHLIMCLFDDRDLGIRWACYLIRTISRALMAVDRASSALLVL
jgi:hypothetical protein